MSETNNTRHFVDNGLTIVGTGDMSRMWLSGSVTMTNYATRIIQPDLSGITATANHALIFSVIGFVISMTFLTAWITLKIASLRMRYKKRYLSLNELARLRGELQIIGWEMGDIKGEPCGLTLSACSNPKHAKWFDLNQRRLEIEKILDGR